MRKMPIKVLFALKPREQFRVTWAKDDDYSEKPRLNKTLQTVEAVLDNGILTTDKYEWTHNEAKNMPKNDNKLDTGRGIAYFFQP